MSFLVKTTAPPKVKSKNIQAVSLLLVSILIIMVVAQLFTFEKFGDVIVGMHLPIDPIAAQVFAAFIVTLEVLALPFFLFMRLSHAMRVVSMVAGWIVLAKWLSLSVWINLVMPVPSNAGLLGATVPITVGWWVVFFALGLVILGCWVSWGVWPSRKNPRK